MTRIGRSPTTPRSALHHKLGYKTVGVIHQCGEKYGRYWDTEILERRLTDTGPG